MEVKFGIALWITFFVLTIVHKNEGSFFDFIPVVSQAKPLYQIIGGSADGARHPKERLARTNPVADVVRPEVPSKNTEAPGDIWREFKDIAGTVVKSEQNVGHEITVGHYVDGNREYDNLIIKDPTSLKRPRPKADSSREGGASTKPPPNLEDETRVTRQSRVGPFTMHQNSIVKTETTTILPEVSNQHGGWIGMSVENAAGQNHCGNESQRCRFDKDCCLGHLCLDAEHYTHAWTCFKLRNSSEGYAGKIDWNLHCGNEGQRCRSDGDCCSNLCFDSDNYTIPWTCLERRRITEERLGLLRSETSNLLRLLSHDPPVGRVHGPKTETTTIMPKVSNQIQYGGWIGIPKANAVGNNLCGHPGQRCRFDKDCCSGNLCFDSERYEDSWTCFDASSSSEEHVKTALNALCGNEGQRCRSDGDCCSNLCLDSDNYTIPWTCLGGRNTRSEKSAVLLRNHANVNDRLRSVPDDRISRVHGADTETTPLPKVSIQKGSWIGMSLGNVVEKNVCGIGGQRCRFDKDCCSGHLCFDEEHYTHAWTCFADTSSEEDAEKTELNSHCGNQGQRCRSDGDCCSNICFNSDHFSHPWTCYG